MGKDSEFYKDKKKKQLLRLRELLMLLPGFAVDYIYSKEVSTQTSTLIIVMTSLRFSNSYRIKTLYGTT